MNVLSVCSGIGAPECAWTPLGFKFVGTSEIEPFPSAVLEHHYPDVPNFGDLNNFDEWNIDDSAISVIVGGTPCQAFSVAGLRRGLDDERGNLSLVFIRLCERVQPEWIVWENVPGCLSSNSGKDFGAFTGALSESGYSFAWRVLDAQYWGVPQRRARLFLIGHRGDWRYPAAVLFEPQGLRGDTQKGEKAGKDIAPTVVCGPPGSRKGNQRVKAEALVLQRMRSLGDYAESNFASTLKARDYKDATDLVLWRQTTPTEYKPDTVTGTILAQMSKRATDILTDHENTKEWPAKIGSTLDAHYGNKFGLEDQHALSGAKLFWQQNDRARRIMPIEAERLQGFPDNYTNITYRGKPAPDSHRYKALGNSMAVPVLRWIGERILQCTRAKLAALIAQINPTENPILAREKKMHRELSNEWNTDMFGGGNDEDA